MPNAVWGDLGPKRPPVLGPRSSSESSEVPPAPLATGARTLRHAEPFPPWQAGQTLAVCVGEAQAESEAWYSCEGRARLLRSGFNDARADTRCHPQTPTRNEAVCASYPSCPAHFGGFRYPRSPRRKERRVTPDWVRLIAHRPVRRTACHRESRCDPLTRGLFGARASGAPTTPRSPLHRAPPRRSSSSVVQVQECVRPRLGPRALECLECPDRPVRPPCAPRPVHLGIQNIERGRRERGTDGQDRSRGCPFARLCGGSDLSTSSCPGRIAGAHRAGARVSSSGLACSHSHHPVSPSLAAADCIMLCGAHSMTYG